MKTLLLFVFMLFVNSVAGQNIENLRARLENNQAIISYDLIGGVEIQKFNVELFSSRDGYSKPLSFVTGDVGRNVDGGARKSITCSLAEEFGEYKGELTFRLRIEVLPLPLVIKKPTTQTVIRRGKAAVVQWEGGAAGQMAIVELYRSSQLVISEEIENTGQFRWTIPSSLEKGDGYSMHIKVADQVAVSEQFTIKPKLPLLVKLSPIIIGAAIVPFLGGGGEPTQPGNEKLPAAPNPN